MVIFRPTNWAVGKWWGVFELQAPSYQNFSTETPASRVQGYGGQITGEEQTTQPKEEYVYELSGGASGRPLLTPDTIGKTGWKPEQLGKIINISPYAGGVVSNLSRGEN